MKTPEITKKSDGTLKELQGEDLRYADLRHAILSGVNLSDADLRDADLFRADLRNTDLRDADLFRADLRGANLSNAILYGADLFRANLHNAILCGADLSDTDLRAANLRGANLRDAILSGAILFRADLRNANLRGADLRHAILSGANLSDTILSGAKLPHFQIVPQEEAFFGYKKVLISAHSRETRVIKVEIPANARRTSTLISRKCRAEFVIAHGNGFSMTRNYKKLEYRDGEITHADKYNDDIRIDYTGGIHFFPTREEAEEFEP